MLFYHSNEKITKTLTLSKTSFVCTMHLAIAISKCVVKYWWTNTSRSPREAVIKKACETRENGEWGHATLKRLSACLFLIACQFELLRSLALHSKQWVKQIHAELVHLGTLYWSKLQIHCNQGQKKKKHEVDSLVKTIFSVGVFGDDVRRIRIKKKQKEMWGSRVHLIIISFLENVNCTLGLQLSAWKKKW